jgi:hypothetical protein
MEPNIPIGLKLFFVTFAINGACMALLGWRPNLKKNSLKDEKIIIAN